MADKQTQKLNETKAKTSKSKQIRKVTERDKQKETEWNKQSQTQTDTDRMKQKEIKVHKEYILGFWEDRFEGFQ